MSEQTKKIDILAMGINQLAEQIHNDNRKQGFYEEHTQIEDALRGNPNLVLAYNKTFNAQRIALMHSELSEGLEGDRKGLQDDHVPEFDSLTMELADAVIRILDTAGFRKLPLAEAIQKKLEYNAQRPFKHGKSY